MNLLRTLLGALTISSFYLMMQAPITVTFLCYHMGFDSIPTRGSSLNFWIGDFCGNSLFSINILLEN